MKFSIPLGSSDVSSDITRGLDRFEYTPFTPCLSWTMLIMLHLPFFQQKYEPKQNISLWMESKSQTLAQCHLHPFHQCRYLRRTVTLTDR